MMVGVRHVIVPDKMLQDNRCSAVVQSGRLVVDIFQYLDYSTMIRMTRVCKLWRVCLNKGVRKLTIANPVRLGAPVKNVLCQFSSLTDLNGAWRWQVCSLYTARHPPASRPVAHTPPRRRLQAGP